MVKKNQKTTDKLYFNKVYCVDTNIILNNYISPFIIGEDGSNLIVLTETILQELDNFKVGADNINYQARKFNKILDEAEIIEIFDYGMLIKKKNDYILILKKIERETAEKNDDKIIQTMIINIDENIPNNFEFDDFKFISNDINFRTKVYLKGYQAEPYYEDYNEEIEFFKEFTIKDQLLNKEYFRIDELQNQGVDLKLDDKYSSIKIIDVTGKPTYLIRDREAIWKKWVDKNRNIFGIKPLNIEQKILWEHLLNPYNDIFIVEANAGSGKNISALACALDLVKKGHFEGITYIRKTIISGDKQDEVGHLPGELSEKMAGYVQPMRDAIETLIRLKNKKKKKWNSEEMNEAVQRFEEEYNISYEYEGHLRGRTIKNQIVILDEFQNETISSMVTILSRMDSSSKVFVLGNVIQIDNPYLNKYNNALSFLMNHCGTFEENIQVQGMHLTKVERGPIPEWIERITKEV